MDSIDRPIFPSWKRVSPIWYQVSIEDYYIDIRRENDYWEGRIIRDKKVIDIQRYKDWNVAQAMSETEDRLYQIIESRFLIW